MRAYKCLQIISWYRLKSSNTFRWKLSSFISDVFNRSALFNPSSFKFNYYRQRESTQSIDIFKIILFDSRRLQWFGSLDQTSASSFKFKYYRQRESTQSIDVFKIILFDSRRLQWFGSLDQTSASLIHFLHRECRHNPSVVSFASSLIQGFQDVDANRLPL